MDDRTLGKVFRAIAEVLDPQSIDLPAPVASNKRSTAASTAVSPKDRKLRKNEIPDEYGRTRKSIADAMTPPSMRKPEPPEAPALEPDEEGYTNPSIRLRNKFGYQPFTLAEAAKSLIIDRMACEAILNDLVAERVAQTWGQGQDQQWLLINQYKN